ncbi:hypothetical protein F4819DRAFT_467676 [Hypoxylon fuscum]|nr:hypothetical protein F4819DRAFT_467676 [Hypoxylon fuscum]
MVGSIATQLQCQLAISTAILLHSTAAFHLTHSNLVLSNTLGTSNCLSLHHAEPQRPRDSQWLFCAATSLLACQSVKRAQSTAYYIAK